MEQVTAKNTQDPEKLKFGCGNEKMKEEQNSKIEPTEATNDIRRVTTNTPAFQTNMPRFFLLAEYLCFLKRLGRQ